MSEERILCSHVPTIRFDQIEGNRVTWYAEPDEQVSKTEHLSLIDMAECGAPLAAMGIRALWKMCADGLIYNSLEQANSIQTEILKPLSNNSETDQPQLSCTSTSIN